MSPFFLEQLNEETKCQNCKNAKLVVGKRVYSVCQAHLQYAREQWRKWAKIRRACGKCISCNNKAWKPAKRVNCLGRRIAGTRPFLRCRTHTMENRAKMKAWIADHPTYSADQWAKRKTLLAQGICLCKEHNRIPPGFRRCDACRARRAR